MTRHDNARTIWALCLKQRNKYVLYIHIHSRFFCTFTLKHALHLFGYSKYLSITAKHQVRRTEANYQVRRTEEALVLSHWPNRFRSSCDSLAPYSIKGLSIHPKGQLIQTAAVRGVDSPTSTRYPCQHIGPYPHPTQLLSSIVFCCL